MLKGNRYFFLILLFFHVSIVPSSFLTWFSFSMAGFPSISVCLPPPFFIISFPSCGRNGLRRSVARQLTAAQLLHNESFTSTESFPARRAHCAVLWKSVPRHSIINGFQNGREKHVKKFKIPLHSENWRTKRPLSSFHKGSLKIRGHIK